MRSCPNCATHPKLLDSGYEKKAKICPVCRKRFSADWEKKPPQQETTRERQTRIDQWWQHLRKP